MKHIILIGFKHTGKSVIGKKLAETSDMPCIDLDQKVEELHEQQQGEKLNCRQIVNIHGMQAFRNLETEALKQSLAQQSITVIATGGGTPLRNGNRDLLKQHIVVHVTSPRNLVFERIMVGGRPAFFSPEVEPLTNFQQIWDERQPVYQELANITISNDGSIASSVQKIIQAIQPSIKLPITKIPSNISSVSSL